MAVADDIGGGYRTSKNSIELDISQGNHAEILVQATIEKSVEAILY